MLISAINYVTLPPQTTNDLHSMSMITDQELLHDHHGHHEPSLEEKQQNNNKKSNKDDRNDETDNIPTIIPLTESKSRAINFAIDPASTNILNKNSNATTSFEPVSNNNKNQATICKYKKLVKAILT